MAEAFARHKYANLIEPQSAGTHPAAIVQGDTINCMKEKGIPLQGQYPKPFRAVDWKKVDLLVNMTGAPVLGRLPKFKGGNLMWIVPDPIGKPTKVYRQVRDQIEGLVDGLARTLEKQRFQPKEPKGPTRKT